KALKTGEALGPQTASKPMHPSQFESPRDDATSPPGLASATSRQSSFSSVPWKVSDVLIGILPLVLLRVWSLLSANDPVLPLWLFNLSAVALMVWIGLYPILIARWRCRHWSWRFSLRAILIELAWSVPLIILALIGNGLVMWAVYYGGAQF